MTKIITDDDFLDTHYGKYYPLDYSLLQTGENVIVRTSFSDPNIYIGGFDGIPENGWPIPDFTINLEHDPTIDSMLHVRCFKDYEYHLNDEYRYSMLNRGEKGHLYLGLSTATDFMWRFEVDESDTQEPVPANEAFATVQELENFWRELDANEEARAANLLVFASDNLRQVALNAGKNLDKMVEAGKVLENTLKQIVLEAVKRAMLTPVDQKPITQGSMTAGPYAETFTFASPAGDIWFKDKEFKLLGLKGQKLRSVSTSRTNIYDQEESL